MWPSHSGVGGRNRKRKVRILIVSAYFKSQSFARVRRVAEKDVMTYTFTETLRGPVISAGPVRLR